MPEMIDFAACLRTTRSTRRIARLFRPPIWEVGKCAWYDHEITSPFAELVMEADSPILLHGWLMDYQVNAEQVFALLRSVEIAYWGECYSPSGELLWEFSWDIPKPEPRRDRSATSIVDVIKRLLRGLRR